MRKLIGSLIIAVMLVVPSPAWAECAWLLWEETRLMEGGRVTARDPLAPAMAYKEKEQCEEALTRALAVPAEGWKKEVIGQTLTLRRAATTLVKSWICLPDTIDPRGPKGGR